MPGLIALVGGGEFLPGCELADQLLLQAAGGPSAKVVILPTAAAHENPRLAAENGVNWFKNLGAQASAAMVVDAKTAQDEKLAAVIEEGSLIYLTGGDPGYLLRTLRGSAAWRSILQAHSRGSILVGSSAGAMVLGGLMWKYPGEGFEDGLRLVSSVVVVPHHDSWGRDRAQGLRPSIPGELALLGVAEKTAAVWSGANWQVLGRGEVTAYIGNKERTYRHGQAFKLS